MNVLNALEWYTLKWLILYYMNFTSIKKINCPSHQYWPWFSGNSSGNYCKWRDGEIARKCGGVAPLTAPVRRLGGPSCLPGIHVPMVWKGLVSVGSSSLRHQFAMEVKLSAGLILVEGHIFFVKSLFGCWVGDNWPFRFSALNHSSHKQTLLSLTPSP